jgi:hypothetical protein
LYAAILTVFAHRLQGSAGAISVLRGLLFGMFAFVTFFFTLGILIEGAGISFAFMVAIVVTILIQAGTLRIFRKE